MHKMHTGPFSSPRQGSRPRMHTGHSTDRRKLGTRMHPGRVSFLLCVEQNPGGGGGGLPYEMDGDARRLA